jgi:hypothetical protein
MTGVSGGAMNEEWLFDFVGETTVIVGLFALLLAIAFVSNPYTRSPAKDKSGMPNTPFEGS